MYEKSFENLLKDKINHKHLKYTMIKCLIDDIIKIIKNLYSPKSYVLQQRIGYLLSHFPTTFYYNMQNI